MPERNALELTRAALMMRIRELQPPWQLPDDPMDSELTWTNLALDEELRRSRLRPFHELAAGILVDAELSLTVPPTLSVRVGGRAPAWLPDDPESETPQQRALPRPSTTPPMWASDPTRTRRRRNR